VSVPCCRTARMRWPREEIRTDSRPASHGPVLGRLRDAAVRLRCGGGRACSPLASGLAATPAAAWTKPGCSSSPTAERLRRLWLAASCCPAARSGVSSIRAWGPVVPGAGRRVSGSPAQSCASRHGGGRARGRRRRPEPPRRCEGRRRGRRMRWLGRMSARSRERRTPPPPEDGPGFRSLGPHGCSHCRRPLPPPSLSAHRAQCPAHAWPRAGLAQPIQRSRQPCPPTKHSPWLSTY